MSSYHDTSPLLRFLNKDRYKTAGTFLVAAGTLIPGVAGKILKIHQYRISVLGTLPYSLNDAKPTGGTVDFGGYLCSGIVTSTNEEHSTPFVPYPSAVCRTTNQGSALCLGTYNAPPTLGTVFFQAVYTDSDTS